jgi:hypothetical protein
MAKNHYVDGKVRLNRVSHHKKKMAPPWIKDSWAPASISF